jgi:DNA-3-methyladenine glycosylase I
LQQEFGSLAAYFWRFEPQPSERPTVFNYEALRAASSTPASTRLSKDLKKRGWTFVGPTTCYAFMQAMGMVNDHIEGCCCRPRLDALRANFIRPV